MSLIKGVDIASFQAEAFSASGSSFAFIKATQGTSYVNPRMAGQATHSRSAGLVTGFYHFLVKGNIDAQAQYFVSKCVSRDGDILACDWETDPSTGHYPSNAEKDQFIKKVKALRPTHKVLLYCNKSFWTGIDKTSYAGDGLWIAAPGTAGSPGIQSAWLLHQYSITGGMDRDVANFPTKQALADWAGAGTDDDMPLTAADVEKIVDAVERRFFSTDGVYPAPVDASDYDPKPNTPGNGWTGTSWFRDVDQRVRSMEKTVAAISKSVSDPAGFVSQLEDKLSKVSIKLEVSE